MSKEIKCVGVKYQLDAFNDKVKNESLNELIKIYKEVTSDDDLPEWCDGDVISALEEEAFDDLEINLIRFGNTIVESRVDPFGIILCPNTSDASEYLKKILNKIGSSKMIEKINENYIG